MKSMYSLCGQNAELLNVTDCDTYSYHWDSKGLSSFSVPTASEALKDVILMLLVIGGQGVHEIPYSSTVVLILLNFGILYWL